MNESLELTKDIYKERKHTFLMPEKCDDSIWINVDPVRFEQILVNLLSNAAKYTDPSGRIELGYTLTETGIDICVKDTGMGIAEEHIGEIFEPFWQVTHDTPRTNGGIGVGLSLTKHIVELHGGTISVKSEGLGKGSIFTVSLPKEIMGENPDIPTYAPDKEPIRHFSFLVVDDNKIAADALTKLLTMKGHGVKTVYSGMAALEMVPLYTPDIILLDIGLPDISGYEVGNKLRDAGFKNKIVGLSGYGQRDDKQKAMYAGFDHYITKPMGISTLEEYLRTISKEA